jgi:integrase
MLLLTRDAGLRAATAYCLSAAEISGHQIRARTKWDGTIVVPFAGRLAEHIGAALAIAEPGQPLVCALGAAGKSTENVLRKRLKNAQKAAGVDTWTWHDLRRTTAQRLYKATGDLRKVQSLLGHRSLLASLHYLNAARETVSAQDLDLYGSGILPPSPSAPPNPPPTGSPPKSGLTSLSEPPRKPERM